MHVVATAGHVDHGKSSLVRALTGTDPDRFAEEKARGLTIDLGFASTVLPSGVEIAFVDVPGHDRFTKNMLAGVGSVTTAVLIVSAVEGWKAQSEEHLRILELFGIRHGLLVLTKVDLVDDEWRELVRMDVEEHVAGTFLADAPLVDVDSLSGRGLPELLSALDDVVAAAGDAADRERPRLWIDRAFAAKGAGTVVTGLLTGGSIAVDDQLVIVPRDRPVRVRALQALHRSHEIIGPGSRVAVNLRGIAHDDVTRGDALVRPRQWRPTKVFDVSLRVLASLRHDLTRHGAFAFHVGSGEFSCLLRLIGAASVAPGGDACARIRVATEIPLLPGDRFVLREHGRAETVGGGEVLDVAPVLRVSRARPSRDVGRVVAERGWVTATELEAMTGERRAPDAGEWVIDPAVRSAATDEIRAAVAAAGPLGFDVSGFDERRRALLSTLDDVVVDLGRARVGGAPVDDLTHHPFVAALDAAPFNPPPPDGVDRETLRELVRRRLVIERDGVFFSAAAVDRAARIVAGLLGESPEGIPVPPIRDALQSSRKHVLPLLAQLDATGVTRRRGDLRIGGPRLPSADDGA
jgi:selenocysteine-specific elongation factor